MNNREYRPMETPELIEPNWTSLAARAADDISRIFKAEIRLFEIRLTSFIRTEVQRVIGALIMLALMFFAALCLIAALIVGIHTVLPWWVALAITGGFSVAVGVGVELAVLAMTRKTVE
ncbi:MAG: phage holin family protein [Candidatus Binataceae bacterium]